MITEAELKAYKLKLRQGWLIDGKAIERLIREVERLNKAYARFLAVYQVDLEHIRTHHDKFTTEIVDIFEPERFVE